MSELFNAREQSHATRQQVGHKVYITGKGASYTPPPPPPGLLSKAGDVAMSAGEAVVDAAMDPVGTAKATGRAVAGGLRDFSQGVIDLSSELGGMIETNVGSLGYLNVDENGVNWSKEPPAGAQPGQLGDLPDVPKGDSMAEGFARGLVQFAAGMAAAPVRGAGMGANMLRSGFADALLDPEEGNLSSLLKGMGLDYAVLDYLDSKVDSDAGPEDRLKARILQAVEGTAIGVPIDVVMYGFRLIRSNKEAVEAVKETLAQAPPPTDTQVMPSQSFFDKAGAATDKFVTQAATTTDEVATNAARATDEFVAKVEPPTDDTPGIIAFHGSAADFDGFKLEKIGTGEGAQAYGYGLYFSDKEAIAEWYRNTLSSMGVDPQPLKDAGMTVTEEMMAASYIRTSNSAEDAARDWANWHGKPFNDDLIDTFKAAQVSDGKMYKVGIAAKPDDLLDYDLPFSEQTPAIQAALKKAGYKTERNMVVKEDGDNRFGVYETNDDGTETLLKHFTEPMLFKGPLEKQAQDFIVEQNAELLNNTGGQILTKLADQLGKTIRPVPLSADGTMMPTEQIASKALFEAGIPGIKYLDNTSRDGAGTSSNYVIFDDSMIKILEKYGIVGPVAISAMALSEDES